MSHGVRIEDIAWQAFQAGAQLWNHTTTPTQFRAWWEKRVEQCCALPACEKCGFDPGAKVTASWTFVVERDPPSLNERLHNEGAARFAYAKERKIWADWFRLARVNNRIPTATDKRRVTLTRLYGGRQQRRDADNNYGGMKICIDSMVAAGLLCDDGDRWAEVYADQLRGEHRGLRVLLEELAP